MMTEREFRLKERELLKRAQGGEAAAYRALGDLYLGGLAGNEKNEMKAYPYWLKAADSGDKIAAGNVGIMLFNGKCGKDRIVQAFPYLKVAGDYSDKLGRSTKPLVMLGLAYSNGIGCEKNKDKAKSCFLRAALKNDAIAQYNLALFLGTEGSEIGDKEYLRWLCCSHINGYSRATRLLELSLNAPKPKFTRKEVEKTIIDILNYGIFRFSGRGANKQEFEELLADNKKRADNGDVLSMRVVGELLGSGYGLNGEGSDRQQAVLYYKKAADQGDVVSAREMGSYYISSDENKAFKYIFQAAAGKEPRALYFLGILYRVGIGCNANPQKAVQILRPYALMNHGDSQYQLYKALMDIVKKSRLSSSESIETTLQAMHWLACAYVNEVEDAIQEAKEVEIENDSVFQKNIRLIKKYGVNRSKYPK